MKPQMNPSGKGAWSQFWEDKVKTRLRRVFSKSDRQLAKKQARDWFILLALALSSCSGEVSRACKNSEYIVLEKRAQKTRFGTGYSFYLYDKSSAQWYDTDVSSFDSHEVGDTIKSLTITITKY